MRKVFLLIALASITLFNTYVYANTTLSYKEWYKEQFGEYPSGNINDWKYDPVYSSYLIEIGETGYNNDVEGETRHIPVYDERYYPQPCDLYWKGYTARWSVEGYATRYQVQLYRNGSRVTTTTVQTRSCSFASHMARGDYEYFFRVRAYNKETGWWSNWEESDTIIVDKNYNDNTDTHHGPGVTPSPFPNPSPTPISSLGGSWQAINNKWYYRYNNGTYASNAWVQINNKWYYFNPDSTMAVGWLVINGKTYYLNPDGSMLTGTVVFDGITHFFGQDGAMVY